MNEKILSIRKLQIFPPVALAPMVGLSHAALRTVVQREGGAGLYFTEMLSAKRLPHENAATSPLLIRGENDRPLIYQIFLFSESQVGPAVDKLHQLGADGVDVNMGCPAPMLRRQGAGDSLADNPELMVKIMAEIRRRTNLPLSVKIRLGCQGGKEKNLAFCRLLEDQGIDFLTIHARMNGEKFCRKPRWSAIGEVKKILSIPVFANGGIFSVKDAKRCLEESGADGLMIGRGAVIRPWLFAEISAEIYGYKSDSKPPSRPDIYCKFSEILKDKFRVERRLGRLKQFTHYFSRSYQFGHHLDTSVQSSATFKEALENATAFFNTTTD
jgi:tRNA-dihydrouridine synthase B